MQNAQISAKTECKGFKTILTKVYEGAFEGDITFKNVLVNGVEFDGSNYNVTVNKNVIGKIISDKRISPEKLAVIDSIEDIIFHSNYVGSGEYIPHGMKKKKGIIRIDLTPAANATYLSSTDTAPAAAVNDNSSSLSNNSRSNIGKNVNVDEMYINR